MVAAASPEVRRGRTRRTPSASFVVLHGVVVRLKQYRGTYGVIRRPEAQFDVRDNVGAVFGSRPFKYGRVWGYSDATVLV
jgi:hypothetical protein